MSNTVMKLPPYKTQVSSGGSYTVQRENSIFMHGYCADELLVQTILGKFESQEPKSDNDNYQATRYIDWNRGTPYVFTSKDVDELRKKVNTKFAFARKVYDPSIVDAIFKNIE